MLGKISMFIICIYTYEYQRRATKYANNYRCNHIAFIIIYASLIQIEISNDTKTAYTK
jgi:hypothetical protein